MSHVKSVVVSQWHTYQLAAAPPPPFYAGHYINLDMYTVHSQALNHVAYVEQLQQHGQAGSLGGLHARAST